MLFGIAHLWLNESFAGGPVDVAAEAAALAVMTAGIILLAHRAPIVARQRAETAEAAAATASRWTTWRPAPNGPSRGGRGAMAGERQP